MLPESTLDIKGNKCSGGQQQKDRLTILFCCNSDGSDKLEPLVVGKYKDPRCFKGIRHLPVSYTNTANAWMTTALFKIWLIKLDNKMKMKNKHILALIRLLNARLRGPK